MPTNTVAPFKGKKKTGWSRWTSPTTLLNNRLLVVEYAEAWKKQLLESRTFKRAYEAGKVEAVQHMYVLDSVICFYGKPL